MFNEGGYVERAQRGEIYVSIIHSGDPSPEIGLPPGTKSQMISYVAENGDELARAHRFLRPDVSLGASGKPDLGYSKTEYSTGWRKNADELTIIHMTTSHLSKPIGESSKIVPTFSEDLHFSCFW
jgi:hypothetical protein